MIDVRLTQDFLPLLFPSTFARSMDSTLTLGERWKHTHRPQQRTNFVLFSTHHAGKNVLIEVRP